MAANRSAVQTAAAIFGVVFLIVGILGFVPGITTDYGTMEFAGHESGAMLIGIFQVSILHNIIHLLYGIAGLVLARTSRGARSFLIAGGVIYALIWLYGLITADESTANFVPLNTADDWLHLVLAIVMIGLGILLGPRPERIEESTL